MSTLKQQLKASIKQTPKAQLHHCDARHWLVLASATKLRTERLTPVRELRLEFAAQSMVRWFVEAYDEQQLKASIKQAVKTPRCASIIPGGIQCVHEMYHAGSHTYDEHVPFTTYLEDIQQQTPEGHRT